MEAIKAFVARKHCQLLAIDAKYQNRTIKMPDYLLAGFLSMYILTRIIPMPSLLANLLAAMAGLLCFGYVILSSCKTPWKGCMVFGAVMCLSLFASLLHNQNGNIYYVLWVFSFLGVAMLLYSCRLNPKLILTQFYAFSGILCVYAILGLPANAFLAIGSENNISTYLLLYLLVYLLSRRFTNAPVALLPIVVAIVITMWTGCRGGLLALGFLLVAAFLYNVLKTSEKKRYLALWHWLKGNRIRIICAIVLICAAVVVVLSSSFFSSFIDKLLRYGGSSSRTNIWSEYISSTFDSVGNLFFGPDIINSSYPWLAAYAGNPHNIFLSLHAHFGLIPLLLIVAMLVWSVIWCLRKKNYILGIVFVAALVRSFFDWTAFPGLYDIIFYFAVVMFLDLFPVSGGVGYRALQHKQEARDINITLCDIKPTLKTLCLKVKQCYGRLAFRAYDYKYKKELTDIATLYDTQAMTKGHHVVSALRYVAVEEYYGQNNFGKNLYIKANKWESEKACHEDLARFDALIKSIEANGYRNDSAIYVDANGNCFNGTHRLALCAWFGIRQIPVVHVQRKLNVSTVSDLKEHYRLSDEEFEQLQQAYQRMRARLLQAKIN